MFLLAIDTVPGTWPKSLKTHVLVKYKKRGIPWDNKNSDH